MAVAAKIAIPAGKQKLPLDRRDLRLVLVDLAARGGDDHIAVRDRALFSLGWAGLLRSGELVGVDWEHVDFRSSGVMLYIPRSKTDQAGQGAWVFVAECEEDGLMCPVVALRWLRHYYVQRGEAQPSGTVFRSWPGQRKRLEKTTVALRLQKALERVGVQSWHLYAAHSLRRGGATWAVRMGVSLRQVQIMGRWASDVVREYLYSSASAMWRASARQQRG
jgi:integrase